uniref:DDE_3 domain-containing protein n=1 Tax=Heterorhabditis bacteriophora TaxID=37862 RepID=A0A1I7XH70_HETBA
MHISRSTTTWLEDNDVATMDWPLRYPDLNPMENLRKILICRIYAGNHQFETVKDLQCDISKVSRNDIKNLVNSMPKWFFQFINKW